MKVIGLFSGAGGLDLGYEQAGFDVVWANEFDPTIWDTYRNNHKGEFDGRDIRSIESSEIPDCDGIIGGPPCQSWSEAGTLRGIEDSRGQLFYEFVRILKDKQPKFFMAENVSGMLAPRHKAAVSNIISMFEEAGYNMNIKLLNAANYGVPQDRERLIFVGFRKDFGKMFVFPEPSDKKLTLKDAIEDLQDTVVPAGPKNYANPQCLVPNHEYMTGGFSTIFMSRNRVRSWNEQSFTIQAGGRHAPLHPCAPKMIKIGPNQMKFAEGFEYKYRRLSVRECARIQTFPDDFIFYYNKIADGYKMVGNAVPVEFARRLATSIKDQINGSVPKSSLEAWVQPSPVQ